MQLPSMSLISAEFVVLIVLSGSSLLAVDKVAKTAFCSVCCRFAERRSPFLCAAFMELQISGLTRVTLMNEQFSGRVNSRIAAILSWPSLTPQRLLAMLANWWCRALTRHRLSNLPQIVLIARPHFLC